MFRKKSVTWVVVSILVPTFFIAGCSEFGTQPKSDAKELGTDTTQTVDERKGAESAVAATWWGNLSQNDRNYRIVVEALYSVDQNIWGQNARIPCTWSSYVWGGCNLMGNWDYSNRSNVIGWGGWCKDHVVELLQRASGYVTTLPGGTYDYSGYFPYRNKTDAINYAQPGEVLQFTGTGLHTCVIISNFHDGRFEVVDANWNDPYDYLIRKHVINTYKPNSKWSTATLRSYVINH